MYTYSAYAFGSVGPCPYTDYRVIHGTKQYSVYIFNNNHGPISLLCIINVRKLNTEILYGSGLQVIAVKYTHRSP